jgi:hypothetical protein
MNMSVYMCICIRIYIHEYIHVYIYINIYIGLLLRGSSYVICVDQGSAVIKYVYVYVFLHIYIYIYIYTYIYIHIYVYTYICIHVYVYRKFPLSSFSDDQVTIIVGTGMHGFNGDGQTGPNTQIGHLYVHILDFIT